MAETTGFWGEDGFTVDDLSTVFDTVGSGLGWFGIGTPEPDTAPPAAAPAGTYGTPAKSNTWIWYAVGGIVVLVAAIFLIKKLKK